MHILHIVGTRPQLIKLAVVHQALGAAETGAEAPRQSIVDTGQHFDDAMAAVFFRELGIPKPDYNLDIHSLPHGAMIGRTLEALERLLLDLRPDRVLVYGDTNATLAGTIAATRLLLPVSHIEAGLRSFDRRGPEEQNRLVADRLADRLYAPTPTAVDNLRREGFDAERVILTGDVMYDCARQFGARAADRSTILEHHGLTAGSFALCTAHRSETTDNPADLRHLFTELALLGRSMPVILPLHPRTRARLDALGDGPWRTPPRSGPGLRLIDPLGYLDMTRLVATASVILTDSGGVQREAFFHGVPAVVFRPHSEWVELVDAGWSILAPLAQHPALAQLTAQRIGKTGTPVDAYGTGQAAGIIARDVLLTPAQWRERPSFRGTSVHPPPSGEPQVVSQARHRPDSH